MRSDYSKPLGDIDGEYERLLNDNDQLLARQRSLSGVLAGCPQRATCIVCGNPLADLAFFSHRAVDYVICPQCGHVQSRSQPPAGYPHQQEDGIAFEEIYPRQNRDDYQSRKNRIYRPKLDWVLNCHDELGLSREQLIGSRWLDLGCGAGYFLDALRDFGASDVLGLEREEPLVQVANEALEADLVQVFSGSLTQAVRTYEAGVYVAWFVLEHIEDTRAFFAALAEKPAGTIFVFSVPVFGFATWLESAFDRHYARQLDSAVHTQLFTDRSINYCLAKAGYRKAAEWIFGQDTSDMIRMLLVSLQEQYPRDLLDLVARDLAIIRDGWQHVLDTHHLASERHILAVRR